jgi:HEAT repeat protein
MPLRSAVAPTLIVLFIALSSGCRKKPAPEPPATDPATVEAADPLGEVIGKLKSTNPATLSKTVTSLNELEIPPEGVARLVELLKQPTHSGAGKYSASEPLSTREAVVMVLLKLGPKGESTLTKDGLPLLREGLKDKDAGAREHTAYAVGLMGEKAAPAVPDLVALCKDKNADVRRAAFGALHDVGPASAVPVLDLLADPDPAVRAATAETLAWLKPLPPGTAAKLIPLLRDKDEAIRADLREQAALALAGMKPVPVEAAPALLAALADVTEKELLNATRPQDGGLLLALRRIGPPAVPGLAKALTDKSVVVRMQAVLALGEIGPAAKEAVPELDKRLDDMTESPLVVVESAVALIRCGGKGEKAFNIFAIAFKSSNPADRAYIVAALARLGRRTREGLPMLAEALGDKDEQVRKIAAAVLGALGPAAKPAIPAMAARLGDESLQLRSNVAEALARLGPAAVGAAPALAKALKDSDASMGATAARALGAIGPAAKDQAGALAEVTGDAKTPTEVRVACAEAMAAIGPGAKAASASALTALLGSPDRELRRAGVRGAGGVGLAEATPQIVGILQKDAFSAMRTEAARALARLGPSVKDPAAVALLKKLAAGSGTPDSQQIWAATAVARIEGDPAPALAVIRKALAMKGDAKTNATPLRIQALEALEELGPAGSAALPQVEKAATEGPAEARARATAALAAFDKASAVEVPKLAELLRDKDVTVRRAAVEALGRLGPLAKPAAGNLQTLVQANDELADAAADALERIDGTVPR